MILAPSILSADFSHLGHDISRVTDAGAQWVHVDVMDGIFVPNITIGPVVVKDLRKATGAFMDCHLMITQPERYIEAFADAGADNITVHAEATSHLHRCLSMIRERGLKAGVALNPSTPIEVIEYCLDTTDLVLIMSVNPGFGGQSFIDAIIPKIARAREMTRGKNILLQIDGGVGMDNLRMLLEHGIEVVVAGSALFSTDDPASKVREMFDIVKDL